MRHIGRTVHLLVATVMLSMLFSSATPLYADDVDLPRYPSIAPDGSSIVLSWRGDLWAVSSTGGRAHRLTSHPGMDSRSAFSPDGMRIAFASDRDGYRNIYAMNADGTAIEQLVEVDGYALLCDYASGPTGEVITFDSRIEGDLYRGLRAYEVSAEGGSFARIHDAFGSAATRSPDGERVLFERGGSSWTRKHYRGPDARDIWLYTPDGNFVQLTSWQGNDGYPQWQDDQTMIFLSDREDDTVNLYRQPVVPGVEHAERLTNFSSRDITHLDVSADGSSAVFLRWDTIYTLDLTDANAEPVALTITATEDGTDRFERKNVSKRVTQAALSPDGKVMATVAWGDIWIRNVESGSPTRRITNTLAHDRDVAWSPDGLKLYYATDDSGTWVINEVTVAQTRDEVREAWSAAIDPQEETPADDEDEADVDDEEEEVAAEPERKPKRKPRSLPGTDERADDVAAADDDDDADDADEEKEEEEEEEDPLADPNRWHDALHFDVTPLISLDEHAREPLPSPDGNQLAYRRGRGEFVVRDLNTGKEKLILTTWDPWVDVVWAPDSRSLAVAVDDRNFNSDVWIIPLDDPKNKVNISRHPNNDVGPRFSADGRVLVFASDRRNDELDVYRVFLDKALDNMLEPELDAYFKDAATAAKKRKPLAVRKPGAKPKPQPKAKFTPSLDDAWLRLKSISSLPGSEKSPQITPAGDRVFYTHSGGAPGDAGIWSVKWDGTGAKRIGTGSVQHMSQRGDKIVVVSSGSAGTLPIAGPSVHAIPIDAEIYIDLQEQSSRKFREAFRVFGEMFYDPNMKGLDWDQLVEDYHTLASRARTGNEFNWIAARLLGELNSSHTGIRTAEYRNSNSQSQGRLGTLHQPVDGGFEITEVIPGTPAADGPMPLLPGDVVISIDSAPIQPFDTIEALLRGKAGDEVLLTIQREGFDEPLHALIEPIAASTMRALLYDQYQADARRFVEEASDGRLGYIHVQSMGQASLDEFERDLHAVADGRDGLIVDVRNNGGGWTADRLLASIMVQQHAYTVPRDSDPAVRTGYPQDRLFIQRYVLPMNMLCNEKSFSNAEIISHAFKNLDRGTLVGEQTYGGVISTGSSSLIDGTSIRLPFRGWYVMDGTDMENNGAMPDLRVPQTPEDESNNVDAQLQAAVADLLKRMPR